MVSKYSADDHVMRELLPQLAEIAPTYCILGNHELILKMKSTSKMTSTTGKAP